ncbi:MAG: 30S ribosomal protein S12 methylthiotransferase RimO [Lachnospiraceae bacterium]|nr:30S ribosomal protein S12 methylthiotransferase RimO [Lachnospiraceae bacterium]
MTNIAFVSLGCDKNLVDSEVMLGLLAEEGFNIVSEYGAADVIIVNTCCFIKDALMESIETIIELSRYKETGSLKGLIVAGCLAQRYEKDIFAEMPEVDCVLGTASYDKIVSAVKEILSGKKELRFFSDINISPSEDIILKRASSAAGASAYLKIAEGCNNFCTYCIIPKLRGKYRSRTIESLVLEASVLASKGVKELILVAQDTACYGIDIYGKTVFHELIKCLSDIEGIEWIRILYCYPEHITDETIEIMAKSPKVVKYIDMPIQHGADSVLKRMGRKISSSGIRTIISKLRSAMPDIAVRTSIITGFPGETEEEFKELLDFINEIKFDRLGVFAYSNEEGSVASKFPNQIPEKIKKKRRDILMKFQKDISAEKCAKELGKEIDVLIEGYLPEEGVYCGRSKKDAPEVDCMVFVSADREIISGEIIRAYITDTGDYDIMGREIDCEPC